jgi:hypothetical protein
MAWRGNGKGAAGHARQWNRDETATDSAGWRGYPGPSPPGGQARAPGGRRSTGSRSAPGGSANPHLGRVDLARAVVAVHI